MIATRGSVYWATLTTREGDEHRHRVVVISRDAVNAHLKPVVALITSTERQRNIPTHVELDPRSEEVVDHPSWIVCHEISTLERDELDPAPIGELSVGATLELDRALAIALGLGDLPDP